MNFSLEWSEWSASCQVGNVPVANKHVGLSGHSNGSLAVVDVDASLVLAKSPTLHHCCCMVQDLGTGVYEADAVVDESQSPFLTGNGAFVPGY